jgi:hypothetical protein
MEIMHSRSYLMQNYMSPDWLDSDPSFPGFRESENLGGGGNIILERETRQIKQSLIDLNA